MPTKNPI